MNRQKIDNLARAVLYEGYVLYPYRASVKNTQRWTFGGIYPQAWSERQQAGDLCRVQVQCLVNAVSVDPRLGIAVRFLHLVDRSVGKLRDPVEESLFTVCDPADWNYQWVDTLEVGDQQYRAWQEAIEREIDLGESALPCLVDRPLDRNIHIPGACAWEALIWADRAVGVLRRTSQRLDVKVTVSAEKLANDLFKVTVAIRNSAEAAVAEAMTRDDALLRSLASAHALLTVRGGEFISLTDPSPQFASNAQACQNIGLWPVLAGDEPQRDVLMAAPIILPDYPQLAPSSPGDLFDSTEIDEILTLRIMTLTDEEKRAAAAADDRVKALLSRTESLAREELMNLHGTVRGLASAATSATADASIAEQTDA
jgi:hydrogenase maturation protease